MKHISCGLFKGASWLLFGALASASVAQASPAEPAPESAASDLTLSDGLSLYYTGNDTNLRRFPVVAMATDSLISTRYAVVGAPSDNDKGRGAAYVLRMDPGTTQWVQEARLVADDGQEGDEFGGAVAIYSSTIYGSTIAVGARLHKSGAGDSNLGAVYVFTRDSATGTWSKQGNTLIAAGIGNFGKSLALTSDRLAVGAPNLSGERGAVFVYQRTGTTWNLQNSLQPGGGYYFGSSLSMRGDNLLIGAPGSCATACTQAYWATFKDGAWGIRGSLAGPDETGVSVQILDDDGHIAVGVPDSRLVGIHQFRPNGDGSQWFDHYVTDIHAPDATEHNFGASLSLAGHVLAISGDDTSNGGASSAYLYTSNLGDDSNVWTLLSKLDLTSPEDDVSGATIALDSGVLLGGSMNALNSYQFDGTNWNQQAPLPLGALSEQFGVSVAMSGTTYVTHVLNHAGAGELRINDKVFPYDQKPLDYGDFRTCAPIATNGTVVIAGHPSAEPTRGGALDLYDTVGGGGWAKEASLVNPTSHAGDNFGCSAAISGDTIVVGAPGAYTDVANGGAAYVFVRSGTSWTLQAKLTPSDRRHDDAFGSAIAISGNQIAAGSIGKGAVYVFTRSGTAWSQTAKVVTPSTDASDDFAATVAIDGSNLLIGAPNEDSGKGAVYGYRKSGATWALVNSAVYGTLHGYYGSSLALLNNSAAIGSPGSGHAEVWRFDDGSGVWLVEGEAFAPVGSNFGNSVAIGSGGYFAVAADHAGVDGKVYYLQSDTIFRDGFQN